MAKLNLAIIGVGLIGGSFGLALKSRLGDDVHITGLCRTKASIDAAVVCPFPMSITIKLFSFLATSS